MTWLIEGLVDLVARDAQRARRDDAAEADDRDVGRAAADVDDHARGRLVDRQAGADGGGHRLLDHVDATGTAPGGGVLQGAPLDAGDLARDAEHHARADQPRRAHLVDEPAQHPLGLVGVGDDAVAQRADGADGARRAAEHLLGAAARGDEPSGADLDGHDRRLLEDDPAPADVDQGVGGAEVDREVTPQGAQPRSGGHAQIVP